MNGLLLERPNNQSVSKKHMLERLQFSLNFQTAIRACKLMTGEMTENEINGSFLTAVCKDNYSEALMRADDHNKAAIVASDFTVGKFEFIAIGKNGYVQNEQYWLQVKTKSGIVQINPTIVSDGQPMNYVSLLNFSYDFRPVRS